MQNILEYVKWRGDIPFTSLSFCEADYLVFSLLSYMPLDGIVPSAFRPELTVGKAVEALYTVLSENKDASIMDYEQNLLLLRRLADSPRFSELYISGFSEISDKEAQEQFAAVSFTVPDPKSPDGYSLVVAYRGTDSTLIGWKENLNMAFSVAIPSQIDAVKYLESAADAFPVGNLYTCGHSKGGNLAVYAAAFCKKSAQERIAAVRSLDGPGFLPEVIEREGFRAVLDRTQTVVPQSSVVGILLEHAEEFTVVRSYAVAAPYQHDAYTWMIDRCGYVTVESMTKSARYLDETLSRWVASMSSDMREKLINGLFGIMEQTGAETIHELVDGKNVIRMLRALRKIDPETAAVMAKAMTLLRTSGSVKNNR